VPYPKTTGFLGDDHFGSYAFCGTRKCTLFDTIEGV
jgi:hypothetical protein